MRRLNTFSRLSVMALVAREAVPVNRGECAVAPSPFKLVTSSAREVMSSFHGPSGTYKAPGFARAASQMPMDSPEFAEEANHLAKAAHNARNFEDAVVLYDRVLAHRRNKLGLFHEDVAATLHNIGRVFIDLRNYAAAENAFTEAAAIYEQRFGKDSLKYADSLGLLALCYRDLRFLDPAEKAFKEALSIFRDHCFNHNDNSWIPADKKVPAVPNESPLSSVAHILSDCAVLFMNREQQDRAVSFLEDSLEIRRFLYTNSQKFKPIIAQTLAKLAEVKRVLGDTNTAMTMIDECISICMETMGRESPATAAAISSKGNILSVTQKYIEARKCYEEACTTYAMAYGKESALVANEMMHIGRMMEMANELKEAEAKYVRAMEITRQALGADHVQLADASAFLANLCLKRRETDRAIPLLRDAIRIRCKYNAEDPQLVFVYHRLAEALAAKKDPEAEAQFLQAIEVHKAVYQKTPSDARQLLMTDVMDDLALFYLEYHLHEKAEYMMREALRIRLERLPEIHPTIGYSYSQLALLYLDKKDAVECVNSCKSSIHVYDQAPKDRQQPLAYSDALMTLGQGYRLMKNYVETEKAFLRALNLRRIQGEAADVQTSESLHELCKLHLEQGKTYEAAQEIEEALKLARRYPQVTAEMVAEMEKTKRSFPALGDGAKKP